MINDDRECNHNICNILPEDIARCSPNQCRIDNGYSRHCAECYCRNCTHSDCDPPEEVEDDGWIPK